MKDKKIKIIKNGFNKRNATLVQGKLQNIDEGN